MKLSESMKFVLLTLMVNLTLSSCSDDDPQPGCYQEEGRRIVATITNEEGTIRGPADAFCGESFTIEPDEKVDSRPLGLFVPCNLSEEFREDGTRVVFSGYVYESFETENICADFFEITEINLMDP